MLSKLFLSAAVFGLASAYPKCSAPLPTTTAAISPSSSATTPPPSSITTAPQLICTGGSTIKTTSDCTYPSITYSYCYSAPPPLTCSEGFWPGHISYGHCMDGEICYKLNETWITTTCAPNGQTAYTTNTLFSGTLAGGVSTVISAVQCACGANQWYSWGPTDGPQSVYCMPQTDCPSGMTTSWSTNTYCATVTTPSYCSTDKVTTPYCACATGLPQYPAGGGAPTTCL
ncbi:hypothetical protein B0H63DRAFT_467921 [Podospora didyma]|uniref:Uncharacterized protein n=1 Tax=Podospora didyma TaxID=330526 RepID=A0AAE0NS48_9PEZI|nr:hypothetical protein B0H63DRAFT_467921 [Podospora didyma]